MENGHIDGTLTLQQRLNDPQTAAALTRLLDRIDTLEQTVNTLARLLEQGPGLVSMATDTVDDAFRQAAAAGVDVDARLRAALQMAEKLTAPDMVEKLDRLLTVVDQAPGLVSMATDTVDDAFRQAAAAGVDVDARLRAALQMAEKLTAPDMVEKLDRLLTLVDQAPGLISMTTDMADDAFRQAAARGVDVDARLRAALQIAEKLTAPDMVERLNRLLGLVEQGPGLMAMVVDMVDEGYRQAVAAGFDPELFVRQGVNVTTRMAVLLDSNEVNALLDSGILEPKTLRVIGSAGRALAETQVQPREKVGMLGLLRALGDPDVQQALGFLVTFGREFGRTL